GLADQLVDQRRVEDRADDDAQRRRRAEVRQVVERAGGEVVEEGDLVAVGEQLVGQVRADEPGPPGDQHPHRSSLVPSRAAPPATETDRPPRARFPVASQQQWSIRAPHTPAQMRNAEWVRAKVLRGRRRHTCETRKPIALGGYTYQSTQNFGAHPCGITIGLAS